MANKLQFFTGAVGRLVWGSLTEKQTKDFHNNPIPLDDQQYVFGVAFPKNDPWTQQFFNDIWGFMQTELATKPRVMQQLTNWFSTFNGFSMKIKDGDAPNEKGQVNTNTVGCYVIKFSSNFQPMFVDPANQQISGDSIKNGYYVQVAGSIAYNGLDGDRAGIYINPTHVRLVAEGDVIAGGIDPETAFGGSLAPTNLPPGARPLGASAGMPQMPGNAAPVQTPQVSAPPQMPTVGAPAQPTAPASPSSAPQMPQPHNGILAGPPASGSPTGNMPILPGM